MAKRNAEERLQGDGPVTPLAKLQSLMEPHTISLYVDSSGNFAYLPKLYRAYGGEEITFKCLNGTPFEVVFKDQTPGDKLYLSDQDPTITINDYEDNSNYRVFEYCCAIDTTVDGKPRVFLDATSGSIGVGG